MEWFGAVAAILTGVAALIGVWATLMRDREALRRVERVVDLADKVEAGETRKQLVGLRDILVSRYVDSLLSDQVKSRKAFVWAAALYILFLVIALTATNVPSQYRWVAVAGAVVFGVWALAEWARGIFLRARHRRKAQKGDVADAVAALERALAERARTNESIINRRLAEHVARASGTAPDSGEAPSAS